MQESFLIETAVQAQQLLKPKRVAILKQLAEPRTCIELGNVFDQTPQQIYYHVKALEKAGLVVKVREERVRGIMQGYYQARARSYWLAPQLVGDVGSPQLARDQASLHFVRTLAEEVYVDIGRLGQRSESGKAVPSLGLSAQVHLPNGGRRAEFLAEVQELFQTLATKYGLPDGDVQQGETFKLALACYPTENED
ncbi:MAG: helix-turn-helix domain-containing protein [Chloroflexota bacterium]